LEYYTEEEARLEAEFLAERERSLGKPLGLAFVTFKSVNMAKRVYDSFQHSFWEFKFVPPASSLSGYLKVYDWKVRG